MFRRCIQLTAYSAVGLLLSGGGAVRHAECQDVVTITKASYNVKKSKLRVHATSSDQPGALLTLVGFGQMNWKNDKYEYKENPVECPDSVTVISDYGGSATAVVCGPPPMPSPTPTPTDPPPTLTPIPLPPPIIIGFKHDLVAGPNVNMVSGTTWPDGDPFLQRQNEGSGAGGTRNPLHLMAASNDYRTVDLPGLLDGLPIADSWIGVYKSLDGGGSWTSTLLPGYPQDDSPEGLASPGHGLQAAADPVIRAGTHGMFYLSSIFFDRGATPQSKLLVARYIDLNNDPANPIQYIDTKEVWSYPSGSTTFIDKPWLAVDVPGTGATTKRFSVTQAGNPASPVSQAVQCGNLYLAWAEIESIGDTVVESRIMFSRSTNCGTSWSTPPQEISDPLTINQGATIAVAPDTGNVYVAWRQLSGLGAITGELTGSGATGDCGRGQGFWKNHPEDWPLESVTLGGVTYPKAEAIEELQKPTRGDMARTVFRHLLAAKLSYPFFDPVVSPVIAEADQWLTDHWLDSKPKGAAKSEGSALASELESFTGGKGPIVCGFVSQGGAGNPIINADDAIVITASNNGGASFDPPSLVRPLEPWEAFDQGTSEYSFRTTAYPTMTVDAAGRIYIAWSEKGEALHTGDPDPVQGDSRIMVGTSGYPFTSSPWTDVNPIDKPEIPGHQIQPSITSINDHLFLVYNDFRKDYSGVFDRFVMDLLTPAQPFRHTVDIRAAVAYPGPSPVFTDYSLLPPEPSTQASRYLFIPTMQGTPLTLVFEQLEFNPPNLPMFKAGTVPFYGDYIDIAGAPPFIPDGSGGWTHNTSASVEPIAHAVWTDNRNVVGPPDGDWTSFVPLGIGGTSIFDETTPVPACDPTTDDVDRTRMRNQDIYTSRLTTGLYVAVPGNSRPLGEIPGSQDLFQRAFVIFTQNGTAEPKFFRLEILGSPPPGGQASFDQFSLMNIEDVAIEAYSSISRTVFVTSKDEDETIEVLVTEISGMGGSTVPGGLQSSVLINPDPSNPPPSDPSLLTGEVYNPAVYNPAVYNPAVYNPAVLNPAVFNPAVFNPAVLNWNVANPAVYNPAVLNPAVYNPAVFNETVFNQAMMALALMNPAVYNPAVLNPAVFNPAVLNPAVFNPAVFNPAVLNPAVLNPAVFNPAVFNPAVLNDTLMNPAVLNPNVYNNTFDDYSSTDFNYVVENHGNATTAYSLNLSLENPPDGLLYQLMVYRIYFTPVANDCELTEAAHQEILINDNDPVLDANLLEPYSDNTFYLDPGDYVVVTLRVIPDPDHATPVDPADVDDLIDDDLSVSVVAQAVNTAAAALGETQPAYDVIGPLVIYTAALPGGNQGSAYTAPLTATGGSGPYTWSLSPGSGPLPVGLTLIAGVISGTPTTTGTFNFTVRVTDGTNAAEQALSISVAPAGGGPVFLVQPTTATAGQAIPAFSVTVLDATASPLPGISVTLAIGNNACPTGTLSPSPPSPSAVTNALGIATFSGISIDRGGYGYTLEATATIPPTIIVESVPFNLEGFCETSPMGSPRVGASMTKLADGRILVAGGVNASGAPLLSAEIYDPATPTPSWTSTGNLTVVRSIHTATLLGNGKVLIVGGLSDLLPASTASASVELFDPAAAGGVGAFASAGTLTVARMAHTATLLGNGKVLIAGGRSTGPGPFLSSAELYDPGAGTFTPTFGPPTTRDSHTATLLGDGRVLLAGGLSAPFTYLSSAELYDPSSDSFSGTGGITSSRLNHTATLLSDGRVLVTGGTDGSGPGSLSTAEIFDPAAAGGVGAFGATGGMSTVRQQHTAIRLASGQILVTGGITASSGFAVLLNTAELFDPTASGGVGAFSDTHSMASQRRLHLTTETSDGRVLVAGGYGLSGNVIAGAELFHPTDPPFGNPGFSATAGMVTPRTNHTSTRLGNGKILVAGGWGTATAELYDSVTETFSSGGIMSVNRVLHTATLLPIGQVLVVGGFTIVGSTASGLFSAELYDPVTNSFSLTGSSPILGGSTATLLPDGRVLVTSGGSAAVYDPIAGSFSLPSPMIANHGAGSVHTATLLPNGKVLVVGGNTTVAELYDPSSGNFSLTTGAAGQPRLAGTATLLPNGKVLLAGGRSAAPIPLASAELYDPGTGTFSATGSLNTARQLHTATLLPNGKVLISGGLDPSSTADAEIYDPGTGAFSVISDLTVARHLHEATVLPDGRVLITGGGFNPGTNSAELYHPGPP